MSRAHFLCRVILLLVIVMLRDVENNKKGAISITIYVICLYAVRFVDIDIVELVVSILIYVICLYNIYNCIKM